jgi:O-antigen ligase
MLQQSMSTKNVGILPPFARAVKPPFYVAGLLLAMGGFVLQLAQSDLTLARETSAGSLLSQSILGVVYLVGAVFLFTSGRAVGVLARAWPVLALPLLAMFSVVWSPDPSLTLRRGFALLGTVFLGLSLATTFDFRQSLAILIRSLALAMALSLLWVVLFPKYGVHQATDFVEPIHAGKWRGIFAHKNFLGGNVAGLTFALLIVFGGCAFKNIIIRIVAIIVTAMCLYSAHSATGFLVAITITSLGLWFSITAVQPLGSRLAPLILICGAGVVAAGFGNDILSFALQALGKDPDLTGRMEVWDWWLPLLKGHWILGYGYFSGLLSIGKSFGFETLGAGALHNGYLDVLMSLGLIGLSVTIGFLLWLGMRSIRLLLLGPNSLGRLRAFPICVLVYAVLHNLVETSFLASNTIVPLILAVTAGMLARLDHDLVRARRIPSYPHTLNLRHQIRAFHSA